MVGTPPTPEACSAAMDLGADIEAQRSSALTIRMIEAADIIFVAEKRHGEAVRAYVPGAGEKVRTILPGGRALSDPIGQSLERYKECAIQIRNALEAVSEELAAGE